MFRVNGIFTTILCVTVLSLLPLRNSGQLVEQSSTETVNTDDSTTLDGQINETFLFAEGLNDSVYSEAFPSSDATTTFSVSESSIENNTELDNTTDVLNQTDAVILPSPEAERHINLWAYHNETFCSCDLLAELCDINCCCDSDCTEEDIGAFPVCYSTSSVPQSEYCFDSDIILRNNTPYKMLLNEAKSLFCVVHDNFQDRLKYKDIPSFSNIQQFERLYVMNVYSWHNNFKVDKPVTSSSMKAGDPLYKRVSSSPDMLFKWRLPSFCFTTLCECGKDVIYMEDMESTCARSFSSIKEACVNGSPLSASYFQNFSVLNEISQNPHTQDMKDVTTTESTTEITSKIESSKRWITPKSDVEIQPLYFDDNSAVCANAVEHVSYIVSHDGTLGITDIKAYFHYRNIAAKELVFNQHFSVKFEWNSQGNHTLKRSGNPGYQIGFPVLIGTESEKANEVINMSDYGLTVMGKDSSGFCTRERKTIHFGQNVKSGCYMKGIFSNCERLQKEIKAVLGINAAPIYVGSFGNADPQNFADWLKVFREEGPQDDQHKEGSLCNNLITGLIIDIAYAAVGLLENPQYKIIGTVFHYIRNSDVHLKFENDFYLGELSEHFYSNTVEISTSVTFYDVTESAVPAYARLPVLRAKLPHDFFYPFLLSTAENIGAIKFYILICVVLLTMFQCLSSCN